MSPFKRTKDLAGLGNLFKNLGKKNVTQVGIFGKKSSRSKGVSSNADIAAIHEFGSFKKGIPMRSFLRMPIRLKAKEIMKEAGKEFFEMFSKKNKKVFWKRIGIAAEAVVAQAFATGGFGKWESIKESTAKRKGTTAILTHTAQLKRAVASRVKMA